jgi:hypothetical protein
MGEAMAERDADQAALRKLKPAIDAKYAAGHFVAIRGGTIIADADSFDALTQQLQAIGKDSTEVLVVQAG